MLASVQSLEGLSFLAAMKSREVFPVVDSLYGQYKRGGAERGQPPSRRLPAQPAAGAVLDTELVKEQHADTQVGLCVCVCVHA